MQSRRSSSAMAASLNLQAAGVRRARSGVTQTFLTPGLLPTVSQGRKKSSASGRVSVSPPGAAASPLPDGHPQHHPDLDRRGTTPKADQDDHHSDPDGDRERSGEDKEGGGRTVSPPTVTAGGRGTKHGAAATDRNEVLTTTMTTTMTVTATSEMPVTTTTTAAAAAAATESTKGILEEEDASRGGNDNYHDHDKDHEVFSCQTRNSGKYIAATWCHMVPHGRVLS